MTSTRSNPFIPELYARMKQMGMLVPEGEDEGQKTFERWEAVDSDPTHFSIIVNPTLDCNLRCWYCYEEHRHGATMTPETLQALCRLVDQTVERPELKTLSVTLSVFEPRCRSARSCCPCCSTPPHAARRKA